MRNKETEGREQKSQIQWEEDREKDEYAGTDGHAEKDDYGVTYEGDFFACSGMDCTGLIPAGIVSEAERESYKELYPSLTPPVLSHLDADEEEDGQL